jgi:hypothetical protein
MIQTDPLRFILWHLLISQDVIATDDLYAFDSVRVWRLLAGAGMRQDSMGRWHPTSRTATFLEETWDAIRDERPASEGFDPADPEAGLPPEAPRPSTRAKVPASEVIHFPRARSPKVKAI